MFEIFHNGTDSQWAVGVVRQRDIPVPFAVVDGPHVLERGQHNVLREQILEQILDGDNEWRIIMTLVTSKKDF